MRCVMMLCIVVACQRGLAWQIDQADVQKHTGNYQAASADDAETALGSQPSFNAVT